MTIRDIAIRTAVVYVALNGLVFSVASITREQGVGWQWTVGLLVLTIPISFLIVWIGNKLPLARILRRGQLPKRSWVPRFRTAVAVDIPRICELEQQVFDQDDALPESVGYEWLSVNDRCLTVMLDRKENIMGFYLLLPLKEHAWESFIKGRIRIIDIPGDWLCSRSSMWKPGSIYVGSFIVATRAPYAILYMLLHIAWTLERGMKKGLKRIYALGATLEGIRLIRDRYRFQVVSPSKNRIDEHDLYMKDVSRMKSLTSIVFSKLVE